MKATYLYDNKAGKNTSKNSHTNHHRPIDLKLSIILLCSLLVVTTEGFGQGTMIEDNFESTYCRDEVSALSRGPVHYDLQRCNGQCTARRAPRDMYRMLVNTTTYSVDNVQVDLRANARRGANIMGFSVVAITEDGGTAGRWVVDEDAEEPEVLRGTCDSLLEGQVIFQAQPSNNRTRVRLVWNPRKTNYGSVIFRAWIVQSLDAIFVVDSPPLTNPLDGREFMEIENHFHELLDAMEVENKPQRRSSPSSQRLPSVRRRNTATGRRNPSRDIPTSRSPQVQTNDGALRRNTSPTTRNGQNQRETINNPKFTMDHFEDAFLARMTSGFDLSASDPFSNFQEENLEIAHLIPHHATFPIEERQQNSDSETQGAAVNSNRSAPPIANANATSTGRSITSRNNTTNANNTGVPNTGMPRPGDGQSDQRFPRQPVIPTQTDSTGLPRPPAVEDMTGQQQPITASQIPTQILPSPIQVQQPNTMNTIRLAPGNPFARFQPSFGQNQFQRNLPSPIGNSALFGINSNPVFANGFPRQSLPGVRGNFGSNGNVIPNSNFLPGVNSPFMPQYNFNQWMPNWNAGTNWGFQSSGGGNREFVPGWNSGQNLAGWNTNVAAPGNPFPSNFNVRSNQVPVSTNMNPNTNLPPMRFGQTRSNPNGFRHNSVGPNANVANNIVPAIQSQSAGSDNNVISSAGRNAGPDGLGSFSDLFHATGGWERK